MNPTPTRTRRLWIDGLFVLLVGALLMAALILATEMGVARAALIVLPPTFVFGLFGLAAIYPCRALPLQATPTSRLITTHGVGALAAASIWLLVWRGWLLVIGLEADAVAPERLIPASQFLFILGVLLYLLSVVGNYLDLASETSRKAEERSVQYRVLAREAELRALKAQIDPHFLFNSLNSISALCGARPDDARAMTELLAEFLRSSLRLGGLERVSLHEELDLVRSYLSIEKVRFGDRLRIEETVDEQTRDDRLPPLILQPLVENAVRHGIASRVDGGVVSLTAKRLDSRVRLVVENDYDPDGLPRRGAGIGLENVRERLATSFDGKASMTVSREGERFRVELMLPVESRS